MSKEQLGQVRAEHAEQDEVLEAKATAKRGPKRKLLAAESATGAATKVVTA